MKFPTNGAKVHRNLYSIVGGVRGHRQEKCHATVGWSLSTDRIHHPPWHKRLVRLANGHVFFLAPIHPIVSDRIIAKGSAVNPARDLGPRIMTAMVGYGREGTAHLG